MSDIRGIVFDKDGTLFDFEGTWKSWTATVLRRLTESEPAARHLGSAVGFDLAKMRFDPDSIVIAGTPQEVAEALLPHLAGQTHASLIELLNEEAEAAPLVETVPLQPFLAGLRAEGYRLGMVTNDAEAPAAAHLRSVGVLEMFDFIAGFDSGFGAKPDPGPLRAFVQSTGVSPQNIVMVGDSTHDLLAGRRAGAVCVGVLTGLATRQTLMPFADAVLPDIGHLPAWMKARAQAQDA